VSIIRHQSSLPAVFLHALLNTKD